MSKLRHILRLYSQNRSKRKISELTGVSRNTLRNYIQEFTKSKLSFEELNELSDKDLDDLFTKPAERPLNPRQQSAYAFYPYVLKELRKKGVTRQLLWEEYKVLNPEGIGLTQFKALFNQWNRKINPVMHIEHKAGDKMFIDFAGEKQKIVDRQTGEITEVEVFVAVLGASRYTYVEAVMSQTKEDLINACQNALEFFGGVPLAIVPDNLKSAVTASSKYEPTMNETFNDFASHYCTAVLPARAYKPRDKSLVENAVGNAYTHIYAVLRKETFYSLKELNEGIHNALTVLNNRLLTGRKCSRLDLFIEIEKPALQPLPNTRYELKRQAHVTVMKNGHVSLSEDKHNYSVPYRYIGKKVKILYSVHSVEIFYQYERIALHTRSRSPFTYTTNREHMASSHRFVSDWSPEKFIEWAQAIDEYVKLFIVKILETKQHPEQAYKSCAGVLSFAKKYSKERLTAACKTALGYESYKYKTIQTILQTGADLQPAAEDENAMPMHENIRGENYYK